jgi:hypothetical protein
MAKSNIVLDADGLHEAGEAFVVCDADWRDTATASGAGVFGWNSAAWVDGQLWCFVPQELRAKRPAHMAHVVVYGVLGAAQSRGYSGPAFLSALAEWAGVSVQGLDLATPAGRCLLIAAIMRSPRMK